MKRKEETVVVLGFKLGRAAGAREVMTERAKDEGVDDHEMFNVFDPTTRQDIEGWLLAAGASVEDAKESAAGVLRSIAEELRRSKRR